ncbi:dual specificity mitogen-activated protein kinase kinase 5-like [Physella acuta]|uniref:dual specificity mitogen-activated protein kinase kinase 5-like n=1 Tax=Physella acuta TaxID=109671 RepID=UPI0027DB365C|nr:dual specificity mitogen-activated protein kinase kinase 5-like [Physella acuta]XP_059177154.1 dual specificity mitogen-activated protein kinase kinase 5-like [Physella acuta]
MTDPPFTIRIRSENNQDMDWMVKPDEVTFLQTLEVFSQIMPHASHTAFEYEDEDGDRITVRSDDDMRNMFYNYFSELSDEDRARGLFPPLIIFPKHPKTPQNRNIHGLKIRTGSQTEEKAETQHPVARPNGIERILSCGNITKESLHYAEILGLGNGGKVYRAIHKPTKQVLAVKEILLDITVEVQKQIISELEILYKCDSRMIISFYGAFFYENRVSICTEFMDGGSLDCYMPVHERALGQISLCVIEGMLYMWNLKILHRDIKPYNILVNTAGQVKLCDFGVSTQLEKSIASSFLGTNVYMAPERVQGHDYGKPAEVWSFGVTLFELATGKLPFLSMKYSADNSISLQPIQLMNLIINEPTLRLPEENFSLELIDFVQRCLQKVPDLRLSEQDLLSHPFMKKQDHIDQSIISEMVSQRKNKII